MSSKVQSMLTATYHLALENMDQIARTNEESSKGIIREYYHHYFIMLPVQEV
uniref:Uncharacterized protein n=1 Tax=Anguilla anguilla TaxID=7936 RepID=A0A0E9TNK5_ANGAN